MRRTLVGIDLNILRIIINALSTLAMNQEEFTITHMHAIYLVYASADQKLFSHSNQLTMCDFLVYIFQNLFIWDYKGSFTMQNLNSFQFFISDQGLQKFLITVFHRINAALE